MTALRITTLVVTTLVVTTSFVKKRAGLLVRWAVSLVCISYLAWAMADQGRQLLELTPSPSDWWLLLAGALVSALAVAVNGVAWAVLLRWLRCPLPTTQAVVAFARTNLLKYIPGGIWHLAGRIQLLRHKGHGWGQAAMAVVLDPLLMAVAALLLLPLGGWQQGLGLLGPLAVVCLLPGWQKPLVSRLLRRVKLPRARGIATDTLPRPREVATAEIFPGQVLPGSFPGGPLLAEMAFVLVRYLGFALCAHGFLPPGVPPGSLLAAFALAWTAGLVIPGAPAGLGVFEVVLVLWLGGVVQDEAALLATALSYRVVSTVGDALAAAGAWGVKGWRGER